MRRVRAPEFLVGKLDTAALTRARYALYGAVGRLAGRRAPTPYRPVFVIGTGRCGSTLFQRIMASHGALADFPGEANELWYPAAYPYATRTIETPPIVVDPAGFTRRAVAAWKPGHAEHIKRVAAGFLLTEGRGARRVLFKSAMISFLVPELLEIFPDARFVHLYRNGFSVVESFAKKEWHKYADMMASPDEYRRHAAGYWNACLEEIARVGHELELVASGRLHELSYEELCAAPRETLASLAGFLEIDASGFGYDVSRIRSSNDKAAALASSPLGKELFAIMESQMTARGYA